MLKRICALSLLLTLGLSLLFVLPVSAATSSERQLVYDLGIVAEPDNSGLIPKAFNRASFAHTLTVMSKTKCTEEATAESAAKYASDIAGNEYVSDIMNALVLGYMKTDEAGKFNPSKSVTKNDALVSLVKVLGYDAIAKANGGELGDYLNLASKIGLLRGVTIADEANLTPEEVAKIVANAMGVPIVAYEGIIGGPASLWELWEVSVGTGTVVANSGMGIAVSKVGANRVRINGTTFYSHVEIPNELVGAKVTYYTVPGELANEVVSIYADNVEENVTLDADEIETIKDKSKYLEVIDINEEKILVDKQGYLMINGKVHTPTKALFELLDSGSATFLDTDSDGYYDVVHMTLLYQAIVEGVNGKTITLRTGKDLQRIDFSNADVMEIYIGKKTAAFSDIKAGMTLGIACDAFTISGRVITWTFSGAEYVRLYASSRSETGVIEVLDGTESFTINGIKRYYGSGYKNLTDAGVLPELKLGFYIEAYYDNQGKLTYYKVISGTEGLNYGYLIAGGVEGGSLQRTTKLKLMDTNGNFSELATSEKFVLDGATVESGSTTYSVNGENDVNLAERQLIRYRVHDGVIREIDTVVVRSTAEDVATSLDRPLSGSVGSRVMYGIIAQQYGFASDAVVFVDGAPADEVNPSEKLFSVVKASQLDNIKYYLAGYDADEDNLLSCLVRYDSNDIGEIDGEATSVLGSTYYCYLVEQVARSIDKSGNPAWLLSLAGDGIKGDYLIPTETLLLYCLKNNTMNTTSDYPEVIRKDPATLDMVIKPGDVVRFKTNNAGDITYLEKVFDFGTYKESGLLPVPSGSEHDSAFVKIDKVSNGKFFYYDAADGARKLSARSQKYSNTVLYHVNSGKAELLPFNDLPSAATGNDVKAFVRHYAYRTYDTIFYIYD